MFSPIALTDAFSGITEIFSRPPWNLEGIKHHKNGDLVKLIHDDGTIRLIPVKPSTFGIDERFRGW
ncbi:hypothetical protein BDE18_3313 [Paracoccus pantotrophus]|uniref:Uncharacterized protein n=1 Tax=Paracoccus pantotrophus TaxID=82367 RepID=A0AAE6NRN9_PARPN|nr:MULTISPECIES: hypothetical protein [Paracoccus]MBT0779537.1 hypothetical protein [Paracoccus sp. pheM1]QFG35336.1 hypothetical protein ESD82_03860 [Paracoccus pantotrophus]RKS44465.1 hypothetical protein BDE18_3313 [Paracoccus pantotrophus]SFY45736.1 hypothetical protein SAMN04244548_05334 [Paracoccus pantotrophus]